MQIITNVDDAQFLKTASVISLDIETETTAPDEEWKKRKYGLSFVAPITHVSFYVPEHEPVVFNQPLPIEFIREVLERPGYTLIGHNIVFDVRSLCGQNNIMLPKGVLVWDTQVIALRTMLAEPDKREASLYEQVKRYAWQDIFYDTDREFYELMKTFRADFATIDDVIKDGQYTKWNMLMSYGGNTQEIINHYVVMDTVLTYYLYEYQVNFIAAVEQHDVKLADRTIQVWPGLSDNIIMEQKISWTSCRQATTGLPLDKEYLYKKRAEYVDTLEQAYSDLLETPDLTNPYPEFEHEFATLVWYYKVFDSLNNGATYSKLTQVFINLLMPAMHSLDRTRLIAKAVDWSDVSTESQPDWLRVLNQLDPTTLYNKTSIAKALMRTKSPVFGLDELTEWVREHCFNKEPVHVGHYKAQLKVAWMLTRVGQNEELNIVSSLTKRSFRYYYLFCMCGINLPGSDDIKYNPFLVTKKFQTLLKDMNVPVRPTFRDDVYEDDDESDDAQIEIGNTGKIDLQSLAASTNTLSCGKKSVDFYLPKPKLKDEDDNLIDNPEFLSHPARHYRIAVEMEAYIIRIDEFLAHAERDGKIHSVISRLTRTTRFSSTTPNLQNLNMHVASGYLIAPPGYRLVELDYSNAENKTGAMTAADNEFAWATETGDFHSNMARNYFKESWADAERRDDVDTLKLLRFLGKSVTFGTAYGMGAVKLAASLKKTFEEAKIILQNKERAYPKVTIKKREVSDKAQERVNKGYMPYITLWTGMRVIIPTFWKDNKKEAAGYKGWNYVQQGGVAEMISRACVAITEWLLDTEYWSYIALNVHDSLVLAVKIEEYETIMPQIIRIMCEQMPEKYCRRTSPKIHFVSEVGPENAFKWGFQDGVEYPWSMDYFINQWGIHELPDEVLEKELFKREAPTWIGPVHEGWTLENEMAQLSEERNNV